VSLEFHRFGCRPIRREIESLLTHLFFDFFGTLVDYSASRTDQGYPRSHQILIDAGCEIGYDDFLQRWDRVAGRFDADAEESLLEYSMHQVGAAFLEQVLDPRAAADALEPFITCYIDEWNQGVVDLADLPAMLDRLAGQYTLAVVTNTHSPTLVPAHLTRMGIAGYFETVVTSIEHGRRKPHPDIFERSLQRVGAVAASSVYVGDSFDADYRGARAAGMAAYLIDPHGAKPVPEHSRLASVLELEARLR